MLSKTKGGGQRQRERGEGERGKETRALISLKKGDIHLMTEGKKKRKKKNKTKYNNNNKTPPPLKKRPNEKMQTNKRYKCTLTPFKICSR